MRRDYSEQCFPILRDFLGYLEVVKGRSAGTVEEYFIDLRSFFRFVKSFHAYSDKDTPIDKISIEDIDAVFLAKITLQDSYEFLNYLRNERKNGSSALARRACSLRVFFKYITVNKGYIKENPLENLETPKVKKSLPKYLTLEQSIDLLKTPKGEFVMRDYCMLTLLLNCGLRRAELASLNLSDMRSDNTIRVLGKGNKERVIYLNQACIEALDAYLPTRPVDGVAKSERDALFYSRLNKRISLQGIHFIMKKLLKDVDGLQNYSTHKLRHTAATLMYRNGVDIRVLQDVLGHENLSTTQIYTHVSNEQIEKAAQNNPLSNISPIKKK